MPAPVLVFGSVNVDLVVTAPALPAPGETVLGDRFQQIPGGKGANQAVAAHRAAPGRGWVQFHAAVGQDELGATSRRSLESEGLATRTLRTVAGAATGVALIVVDARGQNQIAVAAGANGVWTESDWEALPAVEFTSARVFLASLEVPVSAVRCALRRAKAAGLTTILNPAPANREILDGDLLSLVDILTPNEAELAQLTTGPAPARSSDWPTDRSNDEAFPLRNGALELVQRGCGAVLATLGSQGCLLVSPTAGWRRPAYAVPVVDTTAAGDAFNGALAVALAEGRELVGAAEFASAAAALSVGRAGAQPSLPTREQILAFLASAPAVRP